MVCADTSFLVALERGDRGTLEKMRELEARGEVVCVTAGTVAEYYHGAYGSKDRARALRDAKGLLDRFAILDLDYYSGKIWGELAHAMKSDIIGDRDLFIASIALSNKQTLITRNKKHFERVPGLLVEAW